jgi:hypothetical protein
VDRVCARDDGFFELSARSEAEALRRIVVPVLTGGRHPVTLLSRMFARNKRDCSSEPNVLGKQKASKLFNCAYLVEITDLY